MPTATRTRMKSMFGPLSPVTERVTVLWPEVSSVLTKISPHSVQEPVTGKESGSGTPAPKYRQQLSALLTLSPLSDCHTYSCNNVRAMPADDQSFGTGEAPPVRVSSALP